MKIWYLANKKTGRPIKIDPTGQLDEENIWVVGFATKKSLVAAVGVVEHDEEIKKGEIKMSEGNNG